MALLLARMERDGLICRTDNPNDKRSSLIFLTTFGLKKLPLARAVLSEGNKEALKGFTDREITTLSKLLLRALRNLNPEIAAEIESMQMHKLSIRHGR
jgi:DNA-binding MarR family transcriptional regulator